MFGLGFWEIAIVLAVVLVVLGPKNLPSFAKSMGKALREFRSATNDLRRAVESETVDDGPYRDQPSPAPGDDDDEDKPPEGDEPPDDYGSTPALPETTEEAEEAEEPRTKTPDAALVTAKLGDEKVKEAMRSRLRLARKSGSRASATLGKLELRRSKTPEPADAGVKDVEERLATQPVSAGQVEAVIAVADERLDVDDGQIEEEMERPTPVPDGPPRAEAEASPASDQEEPEEAKPAAKGKKPAAKGKKPAAKGKKKPAAKKKPTAKKKPAAKKKPEEAKADSTSKAEPKTKAKAEPKSKSKATAKKAAAAASSDDKAKAAPKKKAKPKAKAKAKADPKAKKPAKKAAKKSTKKSSKKDGGES